MGRKSGLTSDSCLSAQEMRRPAASADKERMAELNEELTADFKKGTFIFALQKEEKGIPLVKLKDGRCISLHLLIF